MYKCLAALLLLSAAAHACPVACPLIYAPVCLENGETASNECVAKCSNSTIKCNYACPCPLPPPPPGSSQTRPMNGTMGPVNGTGPSKPSGPTSRCRSADADLMPPYQCALLPKTGPCRASFQRFFYNASAEECQPFIYGGCQGNTNNFETLDLCNQVCVNAAPTWRCQPACIGQPGCSTNIKCANDTCYPVYGFLDVEPLVLDVNSWSYGPGGNHQAQVSNAQQCCDKCKKTADCNVWSYCSNPDGCGSGCVRSSGPNVTDPATQLGPFGGCKPNGAYMQRTCRLGFAQSLNVSELIVSGTNWTSGLNLDGFDIEFDDEDMSELLGNLTSFSV